MAGLRSGIAKYTQHTFEELFKTEDNPTSPKAKFGGSFVRSSTLRTEKRDELKAYLVRYYRMKVQLICLKAQLFIFFVLKVVCVGGEGQDAMNSLSLYGKSMSSLYTIIKVQFNSDSPRGADLSFTVRGFLKGGL